MNATGSTVASMAGSEVGIEESILEALNTGILRKINFIEN
jgi:hypothetical protein